jgi:3-oxoacyl-[acyl-carrier protein] reductase
MVTVGLRAGFVLGQAAGAQMQARKIRGRMLFITSLHAHTPRNLPHYSATKADQTMIVKELARALGADGIRVNAIAPGLYRVAVYGVSEGLRPWAFNSRTRVASIDGGRSL